MDMTTKKNLKPSSGLTLFLKEIAANPSAMGAACPSSKRLTEYIANQVPVQSKTILELGAGTGAVTAALLDHGIQHQQLIVIERSASLAQHLREQFPQVLTIQGDAAHLTDFLPAERLPADVVVSSLPLRSLPNDLVKEIGIQLEKILKPGALFIQYTYGLHRKPTPPCAKLKWLHSKYIWLNVPPARVEVFRYVDA